LSINKRFNPYQEDSYKLRHDWNSLLEDSGLHRFTSYSDELFPSADDLCRYLADYTDRNKLNVMFNVSAVTIVKTTEGFRISLSNGTEVSCRVAVLATGACQQRMPDASEVPGIGLAATYCDHSLDARAYEGKRVAIVGGGNSAFEVANHLAGSAALIHVLVKRRLRFAWDTHFPGDLRAVNNNILDMYQLKSIHSILGRRIAGIRKTSSQALCIDVDEPLPHWVPPINRRIHSVYDAVIFCIGWKYVDASIFNSSCMPLVTHDGKLFVVDSTWQTTVKGLYVIGAAAQFGDRSAASGFIHGFRHNIDALCSILGSRYFGGSLPCETQSLCDEFGIASLAQRLLQVLSVDCAIYQMHGRLAVAVVVEEGRATIYSPLPYKYVIDSFGGRRHLFVMTYEYGFDRYARSGTAMDFLAPSDPARAGCSAFLHGVFRYVSQGDVLGELHLDESLVGRYVHDYTPGPSHHESMLKNFMNGYLKVTPRVYDVERPVYEVSEISPGDCSDGHSNGNQVLPGCD
jgi:thioredoxin reductase